jgi:hypothetical protein
VENTGGQAIVVDQENQMQPKSFAQRKASDCLGTRRSAEIRIIRIAK